MIVRDVMQREVVTLSPDMSVREVARTLVREGIGGAPVTDGEGTVLGVVSARDVMQVAAREPEVDVDFVDRVRVFGGPAATDEDEDEESAPHFFLPEDTPRTSWAAPLLVGDALDERTVLDVMTPAAFSVADDLSLRELAEFLVRGRIHRALVLDGSRLTGIVTSFDVLRAIAGIDAAEEDTAQGEEP